ncbi:MAG TPA: hypothetical protein PLP39_05995 [Flavobacterium lutivivi]|nr:hypothetical protein [Flavobacterium lutivivi]
MQKKRLHIISFDNPFPPNYGGVVEVFYKIKALDAIGIEIYLHCFADEIPTEYNALKEISKEVFFYKKNKNPLLFFSSLPLSVRVRDSKKLIENITKINAPILFEGHKTTYWVSKKQLASFDKYIRLHNLEDLYFSGLASSEDSLLKKILYHFEAKKYVKYNSVLSSFIKVCSLSKFENEVTNNQFKNSIYIPVFHGNEKVNKLSGTGKYALYHGDLRASDNKKSVEFLIGLFKDIKDLDLIIASSSGEQFVTSKIKNIHNISFVKIQDFKHLKELFNEAQINFSISFQKSGTKLKLLNALFNSRFSIINENIIDDEKITSLCEIASTRDEFIAKINDLKNKNFDDFDRRKAVLETYMNDVENAHKLAKIIFNNELE